MQCPRCRTDNRSGAQFCRDCGARLEAACPACRARIEPGSRFCDAHHIRHRADGGENELENLVLLCRVHHRAVHEDGYRMEMREGVPQFIKPNGLHFPLVPRPAPLEGDGEAVLRAQSAADRLPIGPWTSTPGWNGDRFDLSWAVGALWRKAEEPTVGSG